MDMVSIPDWSIQEDGQYIERSACRYDRLTAELNSTENLMLEVYIKVAST